MKAVITLATLVVAILTAVTTPAAAAGPDAIDGPNLSGVGYRIEPNPRSWGGGGPIPRVSFGYVRPNPRGWVASPNPRVSFGYVRPNPRGFGRHLTDHLSSQ